LFTRSFPRCGIPDPLRDFDEYAAFVQLLERTHSIVESTQIWWSIRPHHDFGTIEVRIADGQTVTDLSFSDTLPDTLQFVAVTSLTGGTEVPGTAVDPSTTVPGGLLERVLASVTGTTSTSDAVLDFSYFVLEMRIGQILSSQGQRCRVRLRAVSCRQVFIRSRCFRVSRLCSRQVCSFAGKRCVVRLR